MSDNNPYKYIDLENIREIAGGEDEFVVEIIGTYLSTVSAAVSGLADAIGKEDYDSIIFAAHKLKGSFKFIGADVLSSLAEQIEAACAKKSGFEAIRNDLGQIQDISVEVNAELEDALSRMS